MSAMIFFRMLARFDLMASINVSSSRVSVMTVVERLLPGRASSLNVWLVRDEAAPLSLPSEDPQREELGALCIR